MGRSHDGPARSNGLDRVVPYFVIAYAIWTVYVNAITTVHASFDTLIHGLPLILVLAVTLIYVWLKSSVYTGISRQIVVPVPEPSYGPLHPIVILTLAALWVFVLSATENYALFWWGSVIALGIKWISTVQTNPISLHPPPLSTRSLIAILAIGVAAIAVTMVANRPDADDSFYLSIPATLLRFPKKPVLLHDTIYRLANLPIQLPVYRIHSYEVLIGAIARITGSQPATIAYMVLPPFFALLSIITWAQLLRLLVPKQWMSTLTIVFLCVLALGEAHHSYGNFAFVRMFQGKAILATVMVPCIVYLALRYSMQGTLRNWLLLFAAQIAAIGITSSGLFVAPAAAGLALASAWSPNRRSTRRLITGLLASSYVFLAAGMLALITRGGEGFVTSIAMPPFTLLLNQTFGPWSASLLLAALLACWSFAEGPSQSRVFLASSLFFFLGALNPYVYGFIADHMTGTSTYWRLFWALPLPVMLAIVLGGVTKQAMSIRPRACAIGIMVLLGVGFGLFFSHTSSLREANHVSLGAPSFKVPTMDYSVAKEVASIVPENGTVLAPQGVATWLPTFVIHPKLLATRFMYLQGAFGLDEAKRRMSLMQYLGGTFRPPGSPEELREALVRYDLTAVVLLQAAPWKLEITEALSKSGWHCIRQQGPYQIWGKTDHPST